MVPRATVLAAFLLLAAASACPQKDQTAGASQNPQAAPSPQTDANAGIPSARSESWTELALDKSGVSPTGFDAVRLGRYPEDGYTRELWRVQWRLADPINLYVVLPNGVTRPPVMLYLYDYHFDSDRFRTDVWCKQATQGGFAAVAFASVLSPERQHAPRPMKQWFVSQLQEALSTSTHDVQMVLNYLASRGDVDVSQVGMYGQGSGGAVAILAAAVDKRIAVLDLLNPWGDWPDWLKESQQVPDEERAAYLQPAFLQSVANLDPVLYIPRLKLKALRIQQVMDDPVTPPAARDKIAAVAPFPGAVVRYKDSQAHFDSWARDGVNGWMREQLQPATERAKNNN